MPDTIQMQVTITADAEVTKAADIEAAKAQEENEDER